MSKKLLQEAGPPSECSWESFNNETDDHVAKQINELGNDERRIEKMNALSSLKKLLKVSEKYSKMWNSHLDDKAPSSKVKIKTEEELQLHRFTGTLRPYQVEGVQWMATLYLGGINGILADEMGLGKTVQIIALFAHFLENGLEGPHLVVAPLSTLTNWEYEFKRFAPHFKVIVIKGSASMRKDATDRAWKMYRMGKEMPVVITAYHQISVENLFFEKIKWKYLIIDEAQKIKNPSSQIAIALRRIKCRNKLLLTGTPLQNNMLELWALLNFIMPNIFNKLEDFSALLVLEDLETNQMIKEREENNTIVTTIHQVLATFMLRRLKKNVLGTDMVPKQETLVYCPMPEAQRNIYEYILIKNINLLKGHEDKGNDLILTKKRKRSMDGYSYVYKFLDGKENFSPNKRLNVKSEAEIKPEIEDEQFINKVMEIKSKEIEYYYDIKMQNPLMMYRKAVGHPYLIAMPVKAGTREIHVDESIVTQSGKMLVLDAMLNKLKQQGHRVLIFSTLKIMLNIIEDYFIMRGFTYCRLDGDCDLDERTEDILKFNTDPSIFAFLLTTRAGGLGINLAAADTVIFFDRDWNPQIDIQAQDRCHRIGQTKPVAVYSLITKNTIDEKVMERGTRKLRLERLVIKDGKFHELNAEARIDEHELLKMLEEEDNNRTVIHPNGYVFSDEELERILDRTELYKQLKQMRES